MAQIKWMQPSEIIKNHQKGVSSANLCKIGVDIELFNRFLINKHQSSHLVDHILNHLVHVKKKKVLKILVVRPKSANINRFTYYSIDANTSTCLRRNFIKL